MVYAEVVVNKLLSIQEVRDVLGGIARTTVYQLINDEELVRVKIGRRALVTSESVEQYVTKLEAGNRSE